jgi:hypothetical protein
MTAIAIVRGSEGVAFATDGVACDIEGRAAALVSKVALFPEWSCVLANRGTALATARMQLGLQRVAYSGVIRINGFDDVLRYLPDVAQALHEEILKEGAHYPHFAFMIAGYSAERDRFESYSLRSREFRYQIGDEEVVQVPYTLGELPDMHFAPFPSQESAILAGLPRPYEPMQDGRMIAVRAICAARLDPGGSPDDSVEQHHVGGFVQLTTLFRDKITSEIVHRWPDPLGHRLDPAAGPLLPDFQL